MTADNEMTGKFLFHNILSIVACILTAATLQAQNPKVDSLLRHGDALRSQYRFDESLDVYYEALDIAEDSVYMLTDSLLRRTVNDRILLSENGKIDPGKLNALIFNIIIKASNCIRATAYTSGNNIG